MIIFTDGSTINNGKKNAVGGIGIYIPKQGDIEEWSLSYSLVPMQEGSTIRGGASASASASAREDGNLQSSWRIGVTNQVSELIAIILAIEKGIKLTKDTKDTIYIYTDSKYSIECATTWSKSWIKNNWKKANGKQVENLWLIYRLVQLTMKYPVIFKHVRAHTEEPSNRNNEEYILWLGNDKADKLAQTASSNVVNLNPQTKILKWHTLASLLICGMKNDIKCDIPFIDDLKIFYEKMFNINT